MRWARLGEVVAEARAGFASGKRSVDGVLQLRMNCLDTEGHLDPSQGVRVPVESVPHDRLLTTGDLLVNTTNSPKLVGKTALFDGHHEPVCFSNHFLRLRVHRDRIDPSYLARWFVKVWKTGYFESICTQWVNQAAIRKERVLGLEVPLPPLPEQRRIAAILDKADEIRRKRRESVVLVSGLVESAFLDKFGHPLEGRPRWPTRPLSAIAEVDRGKFTPRPRNDPTYYGGDYPFIQTGDIVRSDGVLREWHQSLNEEGLRVSRLFPRGAIAVAIAANIGDSTVVDFEFCCPDSVVGIVPKDELVDGFYLEVAIRLLKPLLESRAPQTAQRNINLQVLRPLSVPLPPIELQRRFSEARLRSGILARSGEAGVAQADILLNALSQRAFRGDL